MAQTQPDGYLATPSSGKGNPVLVLHAWWGLNATIKAFCDRLAGTGFVAFAPDIYHGKVTDQIAEAEVLVTSLDDTAEATGNEMAAAVRFLKARTGASGVTVIGFSMGAYLALELSNNAPESIRSVVIFYGTGPTDFSQSQADYLCHFAGSDPYEPAANVDELKTALKRDGRPATFYTYPDTGHWFFEPDRADAYNAAAADLAWERTLAFLKRSSP